MERRIIHADMDAFYASIEELDHPQWASRPLVVGADPRGGKGRGVVSTCNYRARKFGIRSAMPVSRAYQLCPDALFVPPRMDRYMSISSQIMDVFRQFSPSIEPLSLDEAFLDCSGTDRLFGDSFALGKAIKRAVLDRTGLRVSIGVSSIKFIAKIASDLEKPDGLVVVQPGSEQSFLNPLPIERLWGAGPRTCKILKDAGIYTIGQLAERPLDSLPGQGKSRIWTHLHRLSHALDDRGVDPERERKSVAEERTFAVDIEDEQRLERWLVDLAGELAYRLRKNNFLGRTVTLKYRFSGFETHTRSKTISSPVQTEIQLRALALELWKSVDRKNRAIRLLGISVSHSADAKAAEVQPTLFPVSGADEAPAIAEKDAKLESTIDSVNARFGFKMRRGLGHADYRD